MNQEVSQAIDELRKAFHPSEVTAVDDGAGGAYVVVESVTLGGRYQPQTSWMGGHVSALYPLADIYPVFIAAGVQRVDGTPFQPPVTLHANFAGRPAIQVSRRNNQIHLAPQTAVAKFVKVIDYLEKLP